MDTNPGIEKESISFLPSDKITKPPYIEVKYTISGSTFKIQLPIFKGDTVEEFLHFLNEFNKTKAK